MKQFRFVWLTGLMVLIIALAVACQPVPPPMGGEEPDTPPTAVSEPPTPEIPEPVEELPETDLTTAVAYDLGQSILIQHRFDDDIRFRNMPFQLNGLIAVPNAESGPRPVVVIMHGTHPGCPVNEMDVDAWPCAPEDEQPNYSGFDYLVSGLAEAGYVTLSININAENTLGFGEPIGGERLSQIVQQHLDALATASDGGENNFGVPLEGRADLSRVVLIGHSRGGENAYWLMHQQNFDVFPQGNESIAGVLLVAAAVVALPLDTVSAPVGIILPVCDGDVSGLDGQIFYEINRLDPAHSSWIASTLLQQANHNHFNTILRGEGLAAPEERPECQTRLEPAVQQQFLVDYAADFLTVLFADEGDVVAQAQRALGLDVTAVSPTELYGLPATVAFHPPAANRTTLFVPRTADELTTHLLGGAVTTENVGTLFCPEGYYTPMVMPNTEPCRRVNFIVPGQPAHAVLTWESQGASWQMALPEAEGDLSAYTTLSLRVVLDPLSPLNTPDAPQQFSVQLRDSAGNTAVVSTSLSEPALQFPAGLPKMVNDFFEGGIFTGIVPLLSLHMPLTDFAGVDLAQISEVALLFDQTPSGTLFLVDVAATRP